MGKVVALAIIDPEFLQDPSLFLGFDALGDNGAFHFVRDRRDAFHEHAALVAQFGLVGGERADEGLVDLDDVDGKAVEVAQ